jgi:hypothetical protein
LTGKLLLRLYLKNKEGSVKDLLNIFKKVLLKKHTKNDKERMCKAGMRWNNDGAHIVLKLRTLNKTDGSWKHFGEK